MGGGEGTGAHTHFGGSLVHLGTAVQQQLHAGRMAVESRYPQRCVAMLHNHAREEGKKAARSQASKREKRGEGCRMQHNSARQGGSDELLQAIPCGPSCRLTPTCAGGALRPFRAALTCTAAAAAGQEGDLQVLSARKGGGQ